MARSVWNRLLLTTVRRRLFGLVVLVAWPVLTYAAFPPAVITISPATPTQSDVIQISVDTGTLCFLSLPTDGLTVTTVGNTIQLLLKAQCPGNVGVPPPRLIVTTNVGPLPAGAYEIQFSISGGIQTNYQPPELTGTLDFSVGSTIPTLSLPLVGMLAIVLGCLGVLKMKRISLFVLLSCLMGLWSSTSSQEASAQTASALIPGYRTELIVLFDPRIPNTPQPSDIITSAANPSANPTLFAALGNPVSGEFALSERASPERLSEFAANPMSRRALLERYVLLMYASEADAANAMQSLERDVRVLSVEYNRINALSVTPNDRYFSKNPSFPDAGNYQWGMQLLNLPTAWDKERGFAYVAAVDAGIYCVNGVYPCTPHDDLKQNVRLQFSSNFFANSSNNQINDVLTDTVRGHGTHVAGIIAATPEYSNSYVTFTNGTSNTGVAGACWTCSLAVLKMDLSDQAIGNAITYAADHGLQVINMSFGDEYATNFGFPRYTSCNDADYRYQCSSLAYAAGKDVVAVGASGNRYENRIQFPARLASVIAVGGVEAGGVFFRDGYGNNNQCTPGQVGDECGSSYGLQEDNSPQLVAPAKDIVSTVYKGYNYNGFVHCGDSFGPDNGALDGYGDCTGTSMAAPHVTGIAGLMRSANPLLLRTDIKTLLLTNTIACPDSDVDKSKCGAGYPDAAKAVTAALGGAAVKNRLTPLFSFYSAPGNDHFYTTVPQMAVAALYTGLLLPQPSTTIGYAALGNTTPSYSQFPVPPGCFSPCPAATTPRAMVSVFTSHVDPTNASAELAPVYRMSWTCSGVCSHVSHFYTTDPVGVAVYKGLGYSVDGIEGYVFPTTKAQPPGTIKLCRKYATARDDYVLFAGTGANGTTCGSTDGFTKDSGGNLYQDYTVTAGNTDFIGWVYPVRASQPVYNTAYVAAVNPFFFD